MPENLATVKNGVFATLALVGAGVAQLLGGWDYALQTMLWCMLADYVTGMMVAGLFKKSAKSADGALCSRAGFRGICKKCAMLVLVLLSVRLDGLMGGEFCRTAVILFFTANEGLSVLENLGLMGVPYPAFLRDALEVLKKKGESHEGN